jgi:hypothetical protein
MIRFDSNRILLIDADNLGSRKVMLEFTKSGGKCSIASCFEDAKKLFNMFDYDMVLSEFNLSDGNFTDFFKWYQSNVCDTTVFAVTSLKKPELPSGVAFLDKALTLETFMKEANDLLFDFKEFENNLSDLSNNNGIAFELTIDQKCFVAKPIEFDGKMLILGLEKTMAPGTIAKLKITFHDFRHAEIFNLIGVMGKVLTDCQVFQVDQAYSENWNAALKCLNDRQLSITKFMNKVAGV